MKKITKADVKYNSSGNYYHDEAGTVKARIKHTDRNEQQIQTKRAGDRRWKHFVTIYYNGFRAADQQAKRAIVMLANNPKLEV